MYTITHYSDPASNAPGSLIRNYFYLNRRQLLCIFLAGLDAGKKNVFTIQYTVPGEPLVAVGFGFG